MVSSMVLAAAVNGLEEAAYERALLGVVRRVRDELELPERRVDARGTDSVLAPNDAAHWVTM